MQLPKKSSDDLLNNTPAEEVELLNDISQREFREYWDYAIIPIIGFKGRGAANTEKYRFLKLNR